MRLGEDVPGINTDAWKFIADDAGGIAEKVKQKDPEARLVYHQVDRQIGVARWVTASWAEGGAWMIAFRARDPETGEPMLNEPDNRVLECMNKFDMWSRNNKADFEKAVKKGFELREERDLNEIGERTREMAEILRSSYRKQHGGSPVFIGKGL